MTEYKGIKYEKKGDGWVLIFPSGLKRVAPAQTEDQLKAEIDALNPAAEG